ncbi:hypothetical protein BCCGELA001_24140 [Bradyrhizobium sp. CCGE-LA001]|nr:hypothetical protein BCCGELA001_24140 [Bradyrhizobium sp. CCGE-LA001]
MDRPQQEKAPPFGGAFRHTGFPNSLFLIALATLLLAGTIALAHRVLLLLSGFLAATLLLRITLAGVLTLLARILVLLLRHSGKLPCWTSEER